MTSFNLILYLLKYDDQDQTPHFKCVETSTDYNKHPTCSVSVQDTAFEGWFLPFITIRHSLIS